MIAGRFGPLSTAHKTKETAVWDRLYSKHWPMVLCDEQWACKWPRILSNCVCEDPYDSQPLRPTHRLSLKPRNHNNWMKHPRYCAPPIHQEAKWEDSKGLCPSGGEACLQTKENSEKRTNAGEEQDPRAETDRNGVRYPLWGLPRGVRGRNQEDTESQAEWTQISGKTRRPQERFKRPTIASTGRAPQSEEGPKGFDWGELWKPSSSGKPPRTWTWTAAPPTHGLEPHPQPTPLIPHLAPFCFLPLA